MTMQTEAHKRTVEPFNLIGARAEIQSRDEAKKIAVENSYYFIVVGAFMLAVAALTKFYSSTDTLVQLTLLFYGCFLVASGFFVRSKVSRIAAIFGLLMGASALIEQMLIRHKFGFVGLVDAKLVMAALRAIKATFYYHSSGG